MAIVLDGKVYSAPVIQDRIAGGKASITGSFTTEEAQDLAIVLRACRRLAHLEHQLGQVEGLHVDAVLLQSNLVKADGLECRGSRADAADIASLHAVYHTADGGEVPQILLEFLAERMHHMGL